MRGDIRKGYLERGKVRGLWGEIQVGQLRGQVMDFGG